MRKKKSKNASRLQRGVKNTATERPDLNPSQVMRDFSHHSSYQRKKYAMGWRSRFSQKDPGWRWRIKMAWWRFLDFLFDRRRYNQRMLAKLRKDREERRFKPTKFKRLERFERRKFRRSGHR